MGFIRSAAKLGIANKIFNEARKPQNQAKAKELFDKFTNKSGSSTKSRPAASTRTRARRSA